MTSSLGAEGGGHLQSLTLLLLDASKTVLRALASLGVRHAEHVVSLNTAVNTLVPRDWLSQHQALWLLLNAVECLNGLSLGLVLVVAGTIVGGSLASWVLDTWVLATEKGVHGGWWDWLLQKS